MAQFQHDLATAKRLDHEDELKDVRDQFFIPSRFEITENSEISEANEPSIYLCGNSLGLQSKGTRRLIEEELDVWSKAGVYGHFRHPKSRDWVSIDETVTQKMADVVGAQRSEVAVMTTLTTNLHLLLSSFYKPTKEKHMIILEAKAFPSDHYAVESQIQLHGFDPTESMVTIEPPTDQYFLPTEYILKIISTHASTAALILLPGVQYYTGQAFDIKKITSYAKSLGVTIGWDLAHAAGNVLLELHDWEVDFAVWCTYKYLNSGPGGIGGLFVHEKNFGQPRLTGWWAHEKATRFDMTNRFVSQPGAAGFQLSNPSVLDTVSLLGSLDIFAKYGMPALRKKSVALTGYLESLLLAQFPDKPFRIITPADPAQRGAQLSLLFKPGLMVKVHKDLEKHAITVDDRKPDVIRVAPTPLYNTFEDVWKFVSELRRSVDAVIAEEYGKSV
ncbi:pyridoxal phosphate-dependent transferase [Lipomyces japonicus]|uniref:pyridoxal phosphate-dependent transferase n=1 Tax=Lipomyces japonicus TaxID=56871 RepID=UPI0034CEBBB5